MGDQQEAEGGGAGREGPVDGILDPAGILGDLRVNPWAPWFGTPITKRNDSSHSTEAHQGTAGVSLKIAKYTILRSLFLFFITDYLRYIDLSCVSMYIIIVSYIHCPPL